MSSKSLFIDFPDQQYLLKNFSSEEHKKPLLVNGHFHTPFSFSAFTEIKQALQMATDEEIDVLGINDFYTTDGYREFNELAEKYKIFPLFNIEFMALQQDLQDNGIRVNDPANPGRTYFSGKGLSFPVKLDAEYQKLLESVQTESNIQTREMIEKLNLLLNEIGAGFSFEFEELKKNYAKNLLRERHIAKALRIAIDGTFTTSEDKKEFYQKLFSGKDLKSGLDDVVGLENEIRGNLLKAGGKAFVAEDPKAFLSLEQVKSIIVNAGGIPCYPVLLDNPKGEFTDFEGDKELLYQALVEKNVFSLELIPGRNNFDILKDFVLFFHERDFVITFGTEHNTPQLDPIKVSCSNGVDLDDELIQIGYEGACVVAAHQYLKARNEEGYLDQQGVAKRSERMGFVELGNAVIKHFIQNK